MARRYWLLKSDPETFAIDDLRRSPQKTTRWDGVRNYQARNLLRDELRPGDQALFYHSRSDPPAVVGTVEVVRAGYPDPTQFDRQTHGYDAAAKPEAPRWYAVDVRLLESFARPVTLPELRAAKGLAKMVLLRKGSRLSVQPVQPGEWRIVVGLADRS
ncbi:MAG TPA: EVE domain-containing protein [Candidatus Polarisedimenticolaceae bacterium]|nr:EVE domain-containing protein [Candidatus Polarisedimenticolaceae bacterium]